ncbi:DciA family protein [Streptomyces sp. NPDC021096]|uniref:DciA family protein n=1 Tax=Streptomyces sp. NPDC021096 TaxID=3154792 RepID=UPI0033CA52AA
MTQPFDATRSDGPEALGLQQPTWFTDHVTRWWVPALGSESLARFLHPAGIDAKGRLHVICSQRAYATHVRLAANVMVERINELVPAARVTGIRAHMRPVVVLIMTADAVTDQQLLDDVLLETCYDVVQDWGVHHPVVLQHTAETTADQFVAGWAATHTEATSGISAPVRAAVYPADQHRHGGKAVEVRDLELVTGRPDLCLAFCAKNHPMPPLARLAVRAGLTVRQVWS